MLEYDRIDISEGIDINKCEETSSRDVIYVIFIIFYIKNLVMDHFYVMVVMICFQKR